MGELSVLVIILSALLLGTGVLFTGSVAAEESTLEGMEGNGTEADPYVITDVEELQAMNEDFDAHYVLGNDIDASETARWHAGAGFEPIGEDGNPSFTGTFDGQGYTISDLTIDRPGRRNVALFGHASGTVENVHLEDVYVRGGERRVAGLVGRTTGLVSDVSVTGTVDGSDWSVGGVIAYVDDGAQVKRVRADVDAAGVRMVGGAVGSVSEGVVTESYATGHVQLKPNGHGGGLVGGVYDDGAVRQSYSTSDITGDDARRAGGLAGYTDGTVSDVFATGAIDIADQDAGGVVGRVTRDGRAVNAYWNVETTGQDDGGKTDEVGTGLRSAAMTGPDAQTEMNVLDFDHFWTLTGEYPVLEWQVEDVSVSLSETTVGAGERTTATVTLTLDDGSTVTATETAAYDSGGIAAVEGGIVEAQKPGTTEITATVAGESDTARLEITEPPNIELADAGPDAAAVVDGSPVSIPATYENDGGPGSHTAALTVDGKTVARERIYLGADDETTVELEWMPDGAAGTESEVEIDGTALGSLSVLEPGTVSLESVSVPDRVGAEQPFELAVELTNDANVTVVETVAYELEGELVAKEAVAVGANGSTAVLGHETAIDPGLTALHGVTVHNETLEATSEVVEPPALEVTDAEVPDEITAGDEFELTATIENTGGLADTQAVVVTNETDELASENVTVGPDATETISVTAAESAVGAAEYTVSSADDERTATVTVTDDGDDSEPNDQGSDGSDETDDDSNDESDGDSDDGSDGVPGFGAVAALLAVSLGALLARR